MLYRYPGCIIKHAWHVLVTYAMQGLRAGLNVALSNYAYVHVLKLYRNAAYSRHAKVTLQHRYPARVSLHRDGRGGRRGETAVRSRQKGVVVGCWMVVKSRKELLR